MMCFACPPPNRRGNSSPTEMLVHFVGRVLAAVGAFLKSIFWIASSNVPIALFRSADWESQEFLALRGRGELVERNHC